MLCAYCLLTSISSSLDFKWADQVWLRNSWKTAPETVPSQLGVFPSMNIVHKLVDSVTYAMVTNPWGCGLIKSYCVVTELPSVTLSVLATGSRLTLALGANHIRTIPTTRRLHTMHHGVPINTAFNHEIFSSEHCTKVEWISRSTANCKAVLCTVLRSK